MATCRGVDVSNWQSAQNWSAHRADGVVFAFAKASEGQRTRDDRFGTHIKAIKAAGLVPGAYHFAWPNQDVDAEAENYSAAVQPHAGRGFVHWLDLERYSDGRNYRGRTDAQIRSWVGRWTRLVKAAYPGQRVGVYTSGSDIAAGHVPGGTALWYPRYPWGEAGFAKAEAASRPKPSGRSPLFWQFTSQPIDRNLCYLSPAGLRTWAASQEDDVPITAADVRKILTTDGILQAPTDTTSNKFWTLGSYVRDTNLRVRALQAVIAQLAEALAAQNPNVTADELVTRIEGAITEATEGVSP